MRRAGWILCMLVATHAAHVHADDEVSAAAHTEHATIVLTGTELMPLPTVAVRSDAEGVLRVHRRHLAIEGRLGGGVATSARAGGNIFGLRAGASAGYALPVGGQFAVIPMAGYDVYVLRERGDRAEYVQHATFQLVLSWLVYPHVLVEASGQIGVQWFGGARDFVLVAAPRIGLVF